MENSPNGSPLIPVKAVPYLTAIVSLAAVALQFLPPHTVGFQVAAFITALAAPLGLMSPGMRSAPQAAQKASDAVMTKVQALETIKKQ